MGNKSLSERSTLLVNVAKLLEQRADELVDIICKATGKLRIEAMATEIVPAVLATRWYAKKAPRILAPKRRKRSSSVRTQKTWMHHFPYGIIGILSPELSFCHSLQ